MTHIKKGLDLPISGAPMQRVSGEVASQTVAVSCYDYPGLKPTMKVQVGDTVKRGDVLFTDKKTHGVQICAPAGGVVKSIERGHRRFLESVVIGVDPSLDSPKLEGVTPVASASSLTKEQLTELLSSTGLWSAFRTRPFSKVPATNTLPEAVFVTATDTNPLAADPALFLNDNAEAFENGLEALTCFGVPVHLVSAKPLKLGLKGITEHVFTGVHPAGNVGTHINFIRPVSREKQVWHIGYADVVSLGKLVCSGELCFERYVSVAGPNAVEPKIVKSRVGASLTELAGQVKANSRIISGSIWNGRTCKEQVAHLGRYHNQVSVLEEGDTREFMGWLNLGRSKFSLLNITLGSIFSSKLRAFSTSNNGSDRAMVPVGQYEKVMPLDILPTQLLRAILVGDIVQAMELGVLELDEEDLALCTFVCAGKYEYGPILRDNLERIEKET